MSGRFYKLLVCATLLYGANAHAFGLLGNEFSFGMAMPAPTGLSFKFWTSRDTAIDLLTEWNTGDRLLAAHADFLTHDFQQFEMEGATMPMYYGFGVRVRTSKDSSTRIGVRIPIGISYLWNTAPLDFFGELGPRSDVIPSTNFSVDIMLGLRYRFIP